MKKQFIFFLFFFATFSGSALSEIIEHVQIGDLYYYIDTEINTAEVTYELLDDTENYANITTLNIPNSIIYNDVPYNVIAVGDGAFWKCSNLVSVVINNGVTLIGPSAFEECTKLSSVVIPSSVVDIMDDAFNDCDNLTTVTLNSPEIVNTFSMKNIFGSQVSEYILGQDIKTIGVRAFAGCIGLSSFIIPNSITDIEPGAFNGCINLKQITIPNNVTSIGEAAFLNCNNLIQVTLNSDAIINSWRPSMIDIFGSQVTEYIIGEGVTSIGEKKFSNCSSLTSVTIPSSVISIGTEAFLNCVNVTSITLPNELSSIGRSAFKGCTGLTEIIIPNSINSIDSEVFSGCNQLISATLSNTLTSIGSYAFYKCPNLTSIELPESLLRIESGAFSNCSRINNITIPTNLVWLGSGAFSSCDLQQIVWNARNCEVERIYGGYINEYQSSPFAFIQDDKITSFTFGEQVSHIPSYLCAGLSKISSISIPESVQTIGEGAFARCESLVNVEWDAIHCEDFTEVEHNPFSYELYQERYDTRPQIISFTIGENVEFIPSYLCEGMKNVSSITFPKNLKYIGTCSFKDCSNIYSITIPEGVVDIGERAFFNCGMLRQINLPSTLKHIGAGVFDGTFYANKEANWEDKGLYIDKYLLSVSRYYSSSYSYYNSALFNIKEGTYLVADSAAESAHVYELDIPSSLKIIGAGAFANNSTDYYGLHELNLPSTLEYIGERAFAGNNIFSVNVPSSINHIGTDAFKGVTNLLYNGTLDGAPWGADFLNVYEESGILYESRAKTEILTSHDFKERRLVIPNSVIKIHEKAFNENYYIRSIVLGANIEEIESNALYCCYLDTIYSFLKEPIVIPNNAFGWIDFPNTLLYVPQDQLEDYYRADVWREFDVVPMIADVVPTEEEITISTTESEAIIVVELIDGATTYELTVSLLNGTLVATYTYNSQGELISTVYHVPSRTQKDAFQFIVSGLDSGTEYQYTVMAKDEKGNIVETKKGTFETKSPMDIDNIIESSNLRNSKKILLDGQIYILRGEKTYTLTGQEVR